MLCNDVAFLGITRSVLNQLHVTPRMVNTSAAAVAMIQTQEFEVIVVDWREIDNLQEFLSAVRRSKLNQECVLVGIVRDLLDLKQAFAAGVHFPNPQTGLGGADRALLAGCLLLDRGAAAETPAGASRDSDFREYADAAGWRGNSG